MQASKKLPLLLFLMFVSGNVLAADAGLMKRAKELLDHGKAKEAYALLSPRQSDFAGEPDFDYLLGIACLDAGHPNEAVFALERVLAVTPDNAPARAEIARAYFQLGEVDTAKQEFETVQKSNPPAPAAATISKFLDAIEQVKTGGRTQLTAYLEASAGYDSNVNSATNLNSVAIPAFGGTIATLSTNSIAQRDGFTSVSGGINVRSMATPDWMIFAGTNFSKRMNSSKDVFDTGTLDASFGVSRIQGENVYTAALQMQTFYVDNSEYRYADGATVQWLRSLNDSSQLTAYFQYTKLTYPTQPTRNATRYVGGAAYAKALGGDYSPVFYAGAYAGSERVANNTFDFLGNDLYGVRAGGEMKYRENLSLFASLSGEWRRYGGTDPMFLVGRRDDQFDLRLGLTYIPVKQWSVTPQVSYTRNNSNIPINDYDRTMVNVSVRRDFN